MNLQQLEADVRLGLEAFQNPDQGAAARTTRPNASRAKKQATFLRAFEETCSVRASALAAGIDRTTHYEWLKDPGYRERFELAICVALDAAMDKLCVLAMEGVFKPYIYRGRYCRVARRRTLCELADGTKAFEDELPAGAEVISKRTIETHDGAVLGDWVKDDRALAKLLELAMPEKYGRNLGRRPRSRAAKQRNKADAQGSQVVSLTDILNRERFRKLPEAQELSAA